MWIVGGETFSHSKYMVATLTPDLNNEEELGDDFDDVAGLEHEVSLPPAARVRRRRQTARNVAAPVPGLTRWTGLEIPATNCPIIVVRAAASTKWVLLTVPSLCYFHLNCAVNKSWQHRINCLVADVGSIKHK